MIWEMSGQESCLILSDSKLFVKENPCLQIP